MTPEVEQLRARVADLEKENTRLRSLLGLDERDLQPAPVWRPTLFAELETDAPSPAQVHRGSDPAEKIALFRSLFAGRDDVFALAWSNARSAKKGWSPAVVGGPANARRPDRQYEPLTDETIEQHLAGLHHVGLYPLLRGDGCRLLACDFDGGSWALDALAYLDAARDCGLPAVLERSRSGDGAHVWMFFARTVPASVARRIGVHLLREAMTMRAELDLSSYDRLFPTQDFVPKGSFGNLIALPLHGASRRLGTTVFLDPTSLEPYDDQWAFLSTVERVSAETAASLAATFGELAAGPDAVAYRRPAKRTVEATPTALTAVAGSMLGVDRIGVPPALLSGLKHLASIHNPDYYEKERLRFSTHDTPRFIRAYRESMDRLFLPRGLREKAVRMIADAGSTLDVVDAAHDVGTIEVDLRAELRPEQSEARDALLRHRLGVLVAPPGAGKTVVACGVIAHHQVPTLVLVDRKHLVDQWRERLAQHLEVEPKQIGELGGTRKAKGVVDIAMVPSLAKRDDVAELTAGYGLVVVDECHHVPAVTFERAVREIPVQRWLGLTATPYRRDGLHALLTMHCGPVRHRMEAATGSALQVLELVVHETEHLPAAPGQHIQTTFRALVEDEARTAAICADIARASSAGRQCLVLTRWTEHLDAIVEVLSGRGVPAMALHGQIGKKARKAIIDQLSNPPEGTGQVLVATASLLGEGFDCPPLDTLFLAFPIKFKGSVVQYVGRVLRPTDTKTRVEVHDYVDANVPVIARMFNERRTGYASLGFSVPKGSHRAASRTSSTE